MKTTSKKILTVFLALLMIFALSACGATDTDTAADSQNQEQTDGEGVVNLGVLSYCNVEENGLNKAVFEANGGQEVNHVYFDSLTDMMMSLTAGKIDKAVTGEATAKYVITNDDSFVQEETILKATNNYGMLLMADNQELCDEISGAIQELNDDGTLAELQETYIKGYIDGGEPKVEEIASIGDAETITVAVTGDLPPMDFVNENGEPAGFNVALLAAIAEKLGINIDLINVTAGSRAMALTSGKADVIFWTLSQEIQGDDADNPFLNADTPENTVKTLPYFSESDAALVLK